MTSPQNTAAPVPDTGDGRSRVQPLVCPVCRAGFKGSATQRRNVAAGKAAYCSRLCQHRGTHQTDPCVGCGTPVERPKRQAERGSTGAAYCSRECQRKIGSKPKTGRMVSCANGCGVEVWRKPSEEAARAAIYCSPECRRVSQQDRVTWNCEACDTQVITPRSRVGRYCTSKCAASGRRRLPGEVYIEPSGYAWEYVARDGGIVKVQQHRYVMERMLGRPLEPHENVHHRNGARADNAESNLEVWSTAQPAGQRPEDKIQFALEMLDLYAVRLSVSQRASLAEIASGGTVGA